MPWLIAKLYEETAELSAALAPSATREHTVDELADCLEVLQAMATARGLRWEEVAAYAAHKRTNRGGFDEGKLWVPA